MRAASSPDAEPLAAGCYGSALTLEAGFAFARKEFDAAAKKLAALEG